MSKQTPSNIQSNPIENHRYASKAFNNDWGTIAFSMPKTEISSSDKQNKQSFIEKELKYNCIYFLIGYETDKDNHNTIEKVYVGQAGIRDNGESVLERLREHAYLGKDPEKYIDKWSDIVIVTNKGGTWGATELDALEHIFWSLIPVGNRYNGARPTSTGADLARFNDNVEQIIKYFNYFGFYTFNKRDIKNDIKEIEEEKSNMPVDLDKGTTKVPNITTPSKIINAMLDDLPEDVWNDKTVFLDPACKGGEYLHAIFYKLIEKIKSKPEIMQKYNTEMQLGIHILNKQLYGIALNSTSKYVAGKKLCDYDNNIKVIPGYIEKIKMYKSKEDILAYLREEFNRGDMKFDVIIGNPPYNDDDVKASTAIYSKFVEKSLELTTKYFSFIIPSRWYASGRGLDSFRKMMLQGKHIIKLVDYKNSKMVFPNVAITGGVCYFLGDKGEHELCEVTSINNDNTRDVNNRDISKHEVFIRDSIALGIIDKIPEINSCNMEMGVQSVDYFRVKDNPEVYEYKASDEMITIEDSSGELYALREDLSDPYNLIDLYNVRVTHGIGGDGYVIPNTVRILEKGKACSVSYLCVGGAKNREDAERLLKYIKTKFMRFLMLQAISGSAVSRKSFMFVPIQDFTSSSDIDWSQPIADIDKQLYKKYNLTAEEIEYIESTIKPMS